MRERDKQCARSSAAQVRNESSPVCSFDPGPGEPYAGPFQPMAVEELLAQLTTGAAPRSSTLLLAIDGRGGAGKSTLASWFATTRTDVAIVHVDDFSWNVSITDWHEELRHNVLEPVRRGDAVRYRPAAWVSHDRAGLIEVNADCRILILEGTGAIRPELADITDASVWIQTDITQARQRGIARDLAVREPGDAERFWDKWQREEIPFLLRNRPWHHATHVVTLSALPRQVLIPYASRAADLDS